ncbi:hypothetical protein [Haloarcula laminariae]|uniref:hypothetical protein n=1 Tax=Haloarcula laminariae TaxID=2961577 RepID=UPI0024058FF0|nr:hypothetical protein [Halomicroarcula sp. FL173]
MPSRRAVLSLFAGGTLGSLAGCGDSAEGTDRDFGLTTTGATGAPGEAVGVELTARGVGVVTYRIEALPPVWQVTQGDFDPGPTSVREMYPPELLWEPPIGTVTGSFIVAIPPNAAPGKYSLPVQARAGGADGTTVSTATLTVEGATASPTDGETETNSSPRGTATRSARTESGR